MVKSAKVMNLSAEFLNSGIPYNFEFIHKRLIHSVLSIFEDFLAAKTSAFFTNSEYFICKMLILNIL
jgi:hypothetical protein